MIKNQNKKQYDLEERTFKFAKQCRELINKFPRTTISIEDGKQLVRSSGSQAANYIEANESLSKKDFIHRIKICRKEAKESKLWLQLLDTKQVKKLTQERNDLIKESIELTKIFGSILEKCK